MHPDHPTSSSQVGPLQADTTIPVPTATKGWGHFKPVMVGPIGAVIATGDTVTFGVAADAMSRGSAGGQDGQ